jgi:hypothetical protein
MFAFGRRAMRTLLYLCLAALVALAGVAAGWAAWKAIGGPVATAETGRTEVVVDGRPLSIPLAVVRGGSVPEGYRDSVDLAVAWPSMQGLRQPGVTGEPVFVSVLRMDGSIDPAERPVEIHGRFLQPDIWANPGGLMMRRFQPESPYADEELFLSPPDGRAFAARCRKAAKSPLVPEACIWRFRDRGLDVQVRFAPALLVEWEEMALKVRDLVTGLRRD